MNRGGIERGRQTEGEKRERSGEREREGESACGERLDWTSVGRGRKEGQKIEIGRWR